jgi:Spy/CpxP family protein refolding chaperone
MSYGVQSAGLFTTSSIDGSTSNSLRPFANLDLTEDQRTQIRSIFKNAKSEGLTQDQIEQEIESVLTPTQLANYQSNLASESSDTSDSSDSSSSSSSTPASTSSSLSAQGAPPPPGGNPFTDPNGPFANLNLTSDEQSQIAQILSNAQSEGLSFSQVNAQISAILTTSQQSTFSSDIANLPAPPGADGSTSSSSAAQTGVQQQIAAAAALILQQIQQDVTGASTDSTSSGSAASTTSAQDATTSTSTSSSKTTLQQQIAAAAEQILQQIEAAAASSTASSSNAQPPQGPPNPFSDPNGPFANLDLTADQQSEISQILSSAPASGLSFSQVNAQISAVLTTTQQATFASDLASLPQPPGASSAGDASTASASVSGQSQTGSDETTASNSSVSEDGVQKQIAAAESLILQQIQYDLGYAAT